MQSILWLPSHIQTSIPKYIYPRIYTPVLVYFECWCREIWYKSEVFFLKYMSWSFGLTTNNYYFIFKIHIFLYFETLSREKQPWLLGYLWTLYLTPSERMAKEWVKIMTVWWIQKTKWEFWGKILEESKRENNHLKSLIEELNRASWGFFFFFYEVLKMKNKVICNFSLLGQEFPEKHNKKLKSHNHFRST